MGVYLDNAATSWPKPETVYLAVDHFLREVGATPGRGGYQQEEQAQQIADEARAALAQLFHAPDPLGVAFTLNATHAINMALKGLLHPGDHVVTSSIEHNAMWRPLKALEKLGVEITAVPCTPDGILIRLMWRQLSVQIPGWSRCCMHPTCWAQYYQLPRWVKLSINTMHSF